MPAYLYKETTEDLVDAWIKNQRRENREISKIAAKRFIRWLYKNQFFVSSWYMGEEEEETRDILEINREGIKINKARRKAGLPT